MKTTNNQFTTNTGVSLTLLHSNKNRFDNKIKKVMDYDFIPITNVNLAKEKYEIEVSRDLSVPQFLMLRNQGIKVSPSRINFFEIKDIQLALINQKIELSAHSQDQMKARGYSRKDIISAIWTGARTELQFHRGAFKAIVEGLDSFGNPINLVVGCQKFTKQTKDHQFFIENQDVYFHDEEFISDNKLVIISVMPPILDKFSRHITHYPNKQQVI